MSTKSQRAKSARRQQEQAAVERQQNVVYATIAEQREQAERARQDAIIDIVAADLSKLLGRDVRTKKREHNAKESR